MTLSMNQRILALDARGRLHCARCGRFVRPQDFPRQPAHVRIGGPGQAIEGLVTAAPVCARCLQEQT